LSRQRAEHGFTPGRRIEPGLARLPTGGHLVSVSLSSRVDRRLKLRHAIGALLAFAMLAGSASADPVPIASSSGTCTANFQPVTVGPINAVDAVLMRLRLSHAADVIGLGAPRPALTTTYALAGDDTVWGWGAVDPPGVLSGHLVPHGPGPGEACSPALDWSVDVFSVPATPVSFSGALTPGTTVPPTGGAGSAVLFSAAATANYAATIEVASGTVGVGYDVGAAPVRVDAGAPRSINLGTIQQGGRRSLSLDAYAARAAWSVSVAPIPAPQVTATWSRSEIRPGQAATLTVSVHNGPVALGVDVRSDACRVRDPISRGCIAPEVIRSLSTASVDPRPAFDGQSMLSWDGRCGDARGGSVASCPPGRYRAVVASIGPDNQRATLEVPIVVDDISKPSVRLLSPRRLGRRQRLVIEVTDNGSVASVRLRVDDRVRRVRFTRGRVSYRPPHGWTRGSHRFTVTARDGSSNRTVLRGRFRV
jgi:hypothetical protein